MTQPSSTRPCKRAQPRSGRRRPRQRREDHSFLTTLEHYPRYAAIRGELFSPNFPTSSAVQVAGLVLPGAMIEIEAIALLD